MISSIVEMIHIIIALPNQMIAF